MVSGKGPATAQRPGEPGMGIWAHNRAQRASWSLDAHPPPQTPPLLKSESSLP